MCDDKPCLCLVSRRKRQETDGELGCASVGLRDLVRTWHFSELLRADQKYYFETRWTEYRERVSCSTIGSMASQIRGFRLRESKGIVAEVLWRREGISTWFWEVFRRSVRARGQEGFHLEL